MNFLLSVVFIEIFSEVKGDVKIIGGKPAVKGEFPWVASVQKRIMYHYTGGTVISLAFVLTSCSRLRILPRPTLKLFAMAGATLIAPNSPTSDWGGQIRESHKWYMHPKCTGSGLYDFDFGMLHLEKPLVIHHKHSILHPINMSEDAFVQWDELKSQITEESNCSTVGWGFTKFTKPGQYSGETKKLLKVDLKLVTDYACAERLAVKYVEFCEYLNETNIETPIDKRLAALAARFKPILCATSFYDLPYDVCEGDFGGPLVCEGFEGVVAMSAWAPYCGAQFVPSVYYGIVHAWDWIQTLVPGLTNLTTTESEYTGFSEMSSIMNITTPEPSVNTTPSSKTSTLCPAISRILNVLITVII